MPDRLDRASWLRANGFWRDPFAEAMRAEDDKLLSCRDESAFVDFPYYDEIKGDPLTPGPRFIFAFRGGGKTALRLHFHRMFEADLQKEPGGILSVIYNDFESVIERARLASSSITARYHIEHVTALITRRLWGILTDPDVVFPFENLKTFNDHFLKRLIWYLNTFDALSPWQLNYWRKSETGSGEIGLPSHLYRRLRTTLIRCGLFYDPRSLNSLFVDGRLRAWRNKVPAAPNPAQRVSALIGFLYEQYDQNQRNALVLFLRVVNDQIDSQDACSQELSDLERELEQVLNTPSTTHSYEIMPVIAQTSSLESMVQDNKVIQYLRQHISLDSQISLSLKSISSFDLICGIVNICKQLGFEAVYVLVDSLDESPPLPTLSSQQSSLEFIDSFRSAYDLVSPLARNPRILGTPNLVFKFFLPCEVREQILRTCRVDRFGARTITWQRGDLARLLQLRLLVCNAPGTERSRIDTLAPICTPDLRNDIDRLLVEFASDKQSPRALLYAGNELLAEHFRSRLRTPDEGITRQVWKIARERAEEVL
jgi:hypothetical protein